MADSRVFITHSSVDKDLAEGIVRALRLGSSVSSDRIFCSSIDGYGIDVGKNFLLYIQRQLQNTELVVPVITPAYLDSLFCQWELGAAWVREVEMFPIKVDAVSHSQLTGPLEHLHVAEFSTQGLDNLVDRVVGSVGSSVMRSEWDLARGSFIAALPEMLRALERTGWTTTPQARLRRDARLAQNSTSLHRVFHLLRDAAAPQLAGQALNLDRFLEVLTLAADEISNLFSAITSARCRVAIKEVFDSEDDSLLVRDLARSGGTPVLPDPDPIEGNTDFESLWRGGSSYFLSNNIRAQIDEGTYSNTHSVDGAMLPYNSSIVWPVRKKLTQKPRETKLRSSNWQDLVAYLCVDSMSSDTFNDNDVWVGAAVADALFAVIRPLTTDDREAH